MELCPRAFGDSSAFPPLFHLFHDWPGPHLLHHQELRCCRLRLHHDTPCPPQYCPLVRYVWSQGVSDWFLWPHAGLGCCAIPHSEKGTRSATTQVAGYGRYQQSVRVGARVARTCGYVEGDLHQRESVVVYFLLSRSTIATRWGKARSKLVWIAAVCVALLDTRV